MLRGFKKIQSRHKREAKVLRTNKNENTKEILRIVEESTKHTQERLRVC